MKRVKLHDMDFQHYTAKETRERKFAPEVVGCEGYVTNNGDGFGLYKMDGRWILYYRQLHPEYNWATLDEAVSSCLILQKMDALPEVDHDD